VIGRSAKGMSAAPEAPGEAPVIGIVLVDDHAIVRQGLRAVLEREDDLRIVAEASSPAETLASTCAPG
jgi:two-component system, NarL family, response regulator DevR